MQVHTHDVVKLETTFGIGKLSRTLLVQYVLIDTDSSYNVLTGRTSLNALSSIVSTPHLAMKFPNLKGDIITIRVNQMENHECYARSLLVKPCTFTSEKHPRAVDIKNTGGTDSRRDEEDKLVTPSWVNFDPQ